MAGRQGTAGPSAFLGQIWKLGPMARIWPVMAFLAGCAQDPRLETRPTFLRPGSPGGVDTLSGSYRGDPNPFAAWIEGDSVWLECETTFYKFGAPNGSGYDAVRAWQGFKGSLADSALSPWAQLPDSVSCGGRATWSVQADTMRGIVRFSIAGGWQPPSVALPFTLVRIPLSASEVPFPLASPRRVR